MSNRLKPPTLFNQWIDLTLIELTNWRWSWRSILLTATLAPLLNMLALGTFARDSGIDALSYVLTGNIVFTLMFGTMNNVVSHVAFLRMRGVMNYFLTLPIQIPILVLAIVMTFFLLALPSLIVIIVAGRLLLGVPFQLHPLLFAVIPLVAISLSGIGAFIGSRVRTIEEGGALNLLISIVMLGMGAILIPPERLSSWIITLGYLNPATYASSAIRQTLIEPLTPRLWLDMAVLLAIAAASLWFFARRMQKGIAV